MNHILYEKQKEFKQLELTIDDFELLEIEEDKEELPVIIQIL